ncbi:unnamed protein product [Vitrella brassicaformis CCMP3155]|uniref:MmgE/PrpD N-terminal domain-containing protein n=2 Tax=Vitrella brassicaformis TaxID=1169539 RepID=A0A0G4EST1_VITBC|nr:unnamed protein product [Vitrella brassicaformis CCMP3155]|mmetsp:Transcript_26581/g.66093  ORF Transcript_26581/g.66093 Transcript_26581/m.66093 type:complete len:554 (+) Transcript_26581:50-1711(+)|eukprot:CEM01707.1 unnamed protein product [Vitrella brassicaformis CCMP3155]
MSRLLLVRSSFVRSAGLLQRGCYVSVRLMSTSSPGGGNATSVFLPRDSNQALGIGQYAIDVIGGKYGDHISPSVYDRVKLFHTDSVMCGVSALALKTNAPTLLREEALNEYRSSKGACVFGSSVRCAPEKAIAANSSAVREWDSNGTVFGYNEKIKGHQAGEFGHNDFYPVVIAAAQMNPQIDGKQALRAMICLDEIRGRLAEVFSLKTYKIDHVVHGAIASAAVYGAMLGASAEQIESAIGMTVAHYIPWRAIRAGKQLSDSKGASAAISTEAAVLSMKRAMKGFIGPKDIFRNPEAIFRWFEPQPDGHSPFNLILSHSGDDFAVMGMHFKLGLYEHQSAGALEGLIRSLVSNPAILKNPEAIKQIKIVAYEPAFGIIGDPAKRDPRTRQSADHSMVYIVSTMLRKAIEKGSLPTSMDEAWCSLMLSPYDYGKDAITHNKTRSLMSKIVFEHGGAEYDSKYPEGIPTSIDIHHQDDKLSSGLVMFPSGHARNSSADLSRILQHKFLMLGEIAMAPDVCQAFMKKLEDIQGCNGLDLQSLYDFEGLKQHHPID